MKSFRSSRWALRSSQAFLVALLLSTTLHFTGVVSGLIHIAHHHTQAPPQHLNVKVLTALQPAQWATFSVPKAAVSRKPALKKRGRSRLKKVAVTSAKAGSAEAAFAAREAAASAETMASGTAFLPENPASVATIGSESSAAAASENTRLTPSEVATLAADRAEDASSAPSMFSFPQTGHAFYRINGFNAEQQWWFTPQGYKIRVRGGIFHKSIQWESTGKITTNGLEPERFTEERDGKPIPTRIVEFDRQKRLLRWSGSDQNREEPWVADAQDPLSLGYHLSSRLTVGQTLDIQVATPKKTYRLGFSAQTEESIQLPAGTIRTAHVIGKDLEGDRQFEVWLDLDHHQFPVRLLGYLHDGKKVDMQLVRLIFEHRLIYPRFSTATPAVEKTASAPTTE